MVNVLLLLSKLTLQVMANSPKSNPADWWSHNISSFRNSYNTNLQSLPIYLRRLCQKSLLHLRYKQSNNNKRQIMNIMRRMNNTLKLRKSIVVNCLSLKMAKE